MDQVSFPMIRWRVIGVEHDKVVDDGVDSDNPVDEGVVVLDVHMSGGVVVLRVDVVCEVLFTFKCVRVCKTVEALIDRATEA